MVRVLPGQRPLDVKLEGLALASLDSIMTQLVSSASGITVKPVPVRATAIKSAVAITLPLIQIQLGMFGNQNTVCKPTTEGSRGTVERMKTVFRRWEQ